MKQNPDFISPCGLYCGVCAIYISHRDKNQKFKERLVNLYTGDVPGKGTLPNAENFSMAVGKKVILRSVPYRREFGTKKWIQDEEARYYCPQCGNKVFRGVVKCNQCKMSLDLD